MARHVRELTNKKFGRLTVIKRVENNNEGRNRWLCKCSCGNEKIVLGRLLIGGNTRSCGCLREETVRSLRKKETNKQEQRLKGIYRGIIGRCTNERHNSYKYYGKRGISVCDEWLNSFESFYLWALENGYSNDLSIDRINVNGNYEPSNCRWATAKEQTMNRRNSIIVKYNGEVHSLGEWVKILKKHRIN